MSEEVPVSDSADAALESNEQLTAVSGAVHICDDPEDPISEVFLGLDAEVGADGVVRKVTNDVGVTMGSEFPTDHELEEALSDFIQTVERVSSLAPSFEYGNAQNGYIDIRKEDINAAIAAGRLKITYLGDSDGDRDADYKVEVLKTLDQERSEKKAEEDAERAAEEAKRLAEATELGQIDREAGGTELPVEQDPPMKERGWWTRGVVGKLLGWFGRK